MASQKTSEKSGRRSSDSKQQYRRPKDARAFAAQVNDVTTKFLNGELEIETVRAYASLARVVSQTLSVQVTHSRFVKQEPNLSLEPDVD